MVVSLRLPVIAAAAALIAAAALLAPAAGSVGAVLADNTWRIPVPDLEILKGATPKPVSNTDDKENIGPEPPPPPVVIRTTTEITRVPARIEKDEPFVVDGVVRDDLGDGIANAPVDVYLNVSKTQPGLRVAKGITGEDGRFSIRAEVPQALAARDYQVVAAARDSIQGNLLYLESWSDPPMSVFSDTRLKVRAPAQVAEGDEVRITGWVQDVTGGPVREVRVTLYVDGRAVANTLTAADGTYLFLHKFKDPGVKDVMVRYEGSTNYGASFDTRKVSVGGNGLEIATSRAVARNSTLVIAGSVMTEKGTLGGWPVDVHVHDLDLGANTSFRLTTDEAGEFRREVFIAPTTVPGEYLIDYSVPTLLLEDNETVRITAQTFLTLEGPERLGAGERLFANATLVDDTGAPLANRTVELDLGKEDLAGFTDENGTVRWSALVPGGSHVVTAVFQGDTVYQGSEAAIAVAVDLTFLEAARPWWPWLVTGLIVTAIVLWALHPAGRRTLKRGLVVLDPRAPVSLGIDLPGVDTDLPDVWGVGETLAVVARAATREGSPLPSLPLTLEAGSPQKVTTDATGRVRTEVSFASEGTCALVASFAGDRRRRAAEVVREVRVVDYRRAIEEGFEDLRRILAARGVPVHGATPPRELERRLHESLPTLSQDDLDRLLTLFEISDYSERSVGRDEWVVFARAYAAVKGAVVPAAPPRRRLFPAKEVAAVE